MIRKNIIIINFSSQTIKTAREIENDRYHKPSSAMSANVPKAKPHIHHHTRSVIEEQRERLGLPSTPDLHANFGHLGLPPEAVVMPKTQPIVIQPKAAMIHRRMTIDDDDVVIDDESPLRPEVVVHPPGAPRTPQGKDSGGTIRFFFTLQRREHDFRHSNFIAFLCVQSSRQNPSS